MLNTFALLILAILLLPGCGFFWGSTQDNTTYKYFVYVGSEGSQNIKAYEMNYATGFLTEIPGSPFAAAGGELEGFVLHPNKTFLYATQTTSHLIHGYRINPTTGALTALPGSPFTSGCVSNTYRGFITPNGNFIYTSCYGDGNTGAHSVNPITGALTHLTGLGSPFNMATPGNWANQDLYVHPNGNFLYVAATDTNQIGAYSIASNGALTPIAGHPFANGAAPSALEVDASGRFLYVASGGNNIIGHSINSSTGALTNIGSFASAPNPQEIHITSNNYVYSLDIVLSVIYGYSMNTSTGALTALPGSPFAVSGTYPAWQMYSDPAGKFLSVACYTVDMLNIFNIGSNGVLTQATGSPYSPAPSTDTSTTLIAKIPQPN